MSNDLDVSGLADLVRERWYLAGPMSGIPQFNFPLFDRVTRALRDSGHSIISPAELDDPATRTTALASPDGTHDAEMHGGTWGDFLARDVKIVADKVTGVMLLPGWETSRGARLEAFIGLLCDRHFVEVNLFQDELLMATVSRDYVKWEIFNAT